jgi:TPR repeat protein
MKIKEIAYAAQQYLQASTGGSFKRAHVYELLAASFGFNSHAAFGVDTVLAELRQNDGQAVLQSELVKRRCIELGYGSDAGALASSVLGSFLVERQIGTASISSLVSRLTGKGEELEYDEVFGPILLDGLDTAAGKGNALAHYALALMHAPDDEEDSVEGNSYWYSQGQQGEVLTGVRKEWAEAYEAGLVQAEKYLRHLRAAGRLGNQDALLDLADRFDDPSFFEQPRHDVDADPTAIAAIAERMGRALDAKHWLTLAAESGDTDAMLQLIEEYDQGDLLQCWTWVYLSQLVGTDLTQSAYCAINEDGSDYDDDVGGSLHVAGRGGVQLKSLDPTQDATVKLAAQRLFEKMEQSAG